MTPPCNVLTHHTEGHTYMFAYTNAAALDLPGALRECVLDPRHPFNIADGMLMVELASEVMTQRNALNAEASSVWIALRGSESVGHV